MTPVVKGCKANVAFLDPGPAAETDLLALLLVHNQAVAEN